MHFRSAFPTATQISLFLFAWLLFGCGEAAQVPESLPTAIRETNATTALTLVTSLPATTPTPNLAQELFIRELQIPSEINLEFWLDGSFLIASPLSGSAEYLGNGNDGTTILHPGGVSGLDFIDLEDGSIIGKLYAFGSNYAFSPKNDLIAVGGPDIELWNLSDLTLRSTLTNEAANTDDIRCLAFSNNGALLATGTGDGFIYIWQISDGRLVQKMEESAVPVKVLAFSPNDEFLAASDFDGNAWVWQVSDWQPKQTLRPASLFLAFIDDEIILTFQDGYVNLLSIADGRLLRSFSVGEVRDIAVSSDRSLVVTAAKDDSVQFWWVADGALLASVPHLFVEEVTISPDGKMVASRSAIDIVKLWQIP